MEIDEMLRMGILNINDLIRDMEMEEFLKRRSRCPLCGIGDVMNGKCDSCWWEYEVENDYRRECNFMNRPLIYKVNINWVKLWNRR